MSDALPPAMPALLAGRVAIVTGASGGIGAGIARRLAAAGASVVIGFRSDRAGAEHVAAEINDAIASGSNPPATDSVTASTAPRAAIQQVDITAPASCDVLADRSIGEFGRLDILINNAGVQPLHPLATMTADEWGGVINSNATGTFNATQAAVRAMRAGGSIVHIASIEGSAPAPDHAHYAAAKAAVIMYARAAALEFGPRGIRVNAVSPGLIDRNGLAESWPEGVASYRAAAPLGRIGTPEDIGDACVFLASDLARWVTGVNLVVDGGVSMRSTW